MRKLTKFLTFLIGVPLFLGAAFFNGGEAKQANAGTEVTIDLVPTSFNLTTSYASGAAKKATVGGVTFGLHYGMKNNANSPVSGATQGQYIQCQASNMTMYNSTIMPGVIKSVKIVQYAGKAFSLYYSATAACFTDDNVKTGQTPSGTAASSVSASTSMTFDLSGTNAKYFCIKKGSDTSYISKVTIIYEVKSTFSVSYDANEATSGSVPVDSADYSSGDLVTVKANENSLAKTGFSFGGWNTNASGTGTNYAPEDTFTITEDTILYAKWTAKTLISVEFTNDEPSKTTYYEGESYSVSGLKLNLTYSDESVEEIDIEDADDVTIFPEIASLSDESFLVEATVDGITTTISKEVAVTVSENTMSLIWNDGFDNNYVFLKEDKITSTHIGTVKASWKAATSEHEKTQTLVFGDDYSLGFYASKSNSDATENIPEIEINSLPFTVTLECRDLYIGASYNGKITFKSTAFTVRNWRNVIKSTSISASISYSNSKEVKTGTLAVTSSYNTYTSISGTYVRVGSGSNGGSVVFECSSNISSISVNASSYSASENYLYINDTKYGSLASSGTDISVSNLGSKTVTIKAKGSKQRFNLNSITITCSGDVDISKTEDCLILEEYIESYLYMNSDVPNQCLTLYEPAKNAFISLSTNQKDLFANNSAYSAEFLRLKSWAAANGETIVSSSGNISFASTSILSMKTLGNDSNLISIIVIVVGVTIAGCSYLIFRKKKHA